jgi:H+/gluconate symporter-like permease
MVGLTGLVLSLALLMFLAYRGMSVIVLAPLLGMLSVAFSAGELPILAAYTQIFMPALGKFIVLFFPLFLLGAIFGKLMEASGYAASIADAISSTLGSRHAVMAVVLCCAVLTYGGVSLFVVGFAIFSLASQLFQTADIPRRLIPGAIALGSGTFTMTALPGTIQIQNLIPMPYFKTTAFAAPLLGVIAAVCMFVLGMWWLNYRARAAARKLEGYDSAARDTVSRVVLDRGNAEHSIDQTPPFALAIAPVVCVLVCNLLFSKWWMPTWDAEYLLPEPHGKVALKDVLGLWSSILALVVACVLILLCSSRCRRRLNESLKVAAMGSLLPVFNTASEFGYGTTIAALPAFSIVKNAVLNIAPNNPLISEAVAVNVLAGITGSASGGLGIALQSLGKTYYDLAIQHGISPEVMHRVASIASGGLDSLPHNGAVITLLTICGLTHKQSYLDIGVVTVIVPLIALVVVIALASMNIGLS